MDRQADETPLRHLIVDTGAWVFGRSLLIPAGLVTTIAEENRVITVRCTRAEAKAAPRFGTDRETLDPEYLSAVGGYYASLPMIRMLPGSGSTGARADEDDEARGRQRARSGEVTATAVHLVRARDARHSMRIPQATDERP